MSGIVPQSLIRSIVAVYNPRRIILFGSRARGDARADSDLDLLVVVDDDGPPLHWEQRHAARRGYAGAVDIIPYSASKFARRARASGTFAHTVSAEGVTVYERS